MVSLKTVATVLNGDRSSNYPSKSEFLNYGEPFINAGHLQDGKIDYTNMDYISSEKLSSLSGARIQSGDILLCLRGSLGKYAFVSKDGGAPASSIAVIRANSKVMNPNYLAHVVSSSIFQKQIDVENNGSSQPNLSASSVESFLIPCPDIVEQKHVAEALSDADELIASLEKLIEKKKAIKQGAMQELLTGKRRLPGFSGEWKTSSLITLCNSITDGSHESPVETDYGYYMPSVKDMTDGGFNYSTCKQISKSDYDKLVRNGCQPIEGDVLIAKDGSILKHAFVYEQSAPTVILSSIAIIRPNKDTIDSQYLSQYFRQDSFVENVILNYKTGTGVPRIVLNNFKKIEIFHPTSIDEQIAISEILTSIDADIEMIGIKIDKAHHIKQGMMQHLLTGNIHLV